MIVLRWHLGDKLLPFSNKLLLDMHFYSLFNFSNDFAMDVELYTLNIFFIYFPLGDNLSLINYSSNNSSLCINGFVLNVDVDIIFAVYFNSFD